MEHSIPQLFGIEFSRGDEIAGAMMDIVVDLDEPDEIFKRAIKETVAYTENEQLYAFLMLGRMVEGQHALVNPDKCKKVALGVAFRKILKRLR